MTTSSELFLEDYRPPTPKVSPLTGSQRMVAGFALIILIGTILLRLPIASTVPGGVSWIDAFFTATSAVTVTGLTLFSTATTYTRFGQIVILLLLQIGGVGFIALSVVLYRLAGRHVGLQDRFLLQENLGVSEGNNVLRLTRYILGIVLFIEFLGAGFLFLRWRAMMPSDEAAYLAVFHSISAFCNAGFDLFSGSMYEPLFGYQRDPWSLTVLGALIFIGALGIPVVDDLVRSRGSGRLSLHTKLTLAITLFLTISGIVVFLIDAQLSNNVLGQMAWDEQFWVGSFSIISARTAGITIIPTDQLGEASKLILMVSMFIGGAPSSMAGGVSTSVAVVVALAMRATVRGEKQAVAFGRAMPQETILKAVAVMTVSTLVVVFITLIMVLLQSGDLLTVGFEVISAFSNTGYSIGLTGELTNVGKLLIAFVMFWGRLGPLTLIVVLAQRHHPSLVTYPEEKVIMG